jgi:hypothetical protein
MVMRFDNANRRAALPAVLAAAAALLVAACSTGTSSHNASNTSGAAPTVSTSPSGMPGMPGMTEPMPAGDGLSASESGFSLVPATTTISANTADAFTFRITTPDGAPVIQIVPEQTKLLHFYLIRSDLTGFAHLHPTMAADGTWSVTLPAMTPGDWRAYTQFTARQLGDVTVPLVLSTALTVPGESTAAPIPGPSNTASVDGYTLTVAGQPVAAQHSLLTLDFSSSGQPVTDLQSYLDTYAHVTAIRAGNLAFAHLHPSNPVNGHHGGPTLSIESAFPASGDWRLFIEFQTAGTVHTAETTIHVA